MQLSYREGCVRPLSKEEKDLMRQEIKSFMVEHPLEAEQKSQVEICQDISCYCRLEPDFFTDK